MLKIHLLIALFIVFNAQGQKLDKNYHLKQTIRQNNQQYEFRVMEADEKVYHYQKGKYYFWLKTQQVHTTQGYSSGSLLHGEFSAFYPSKQLAQHGFFFKGLKNGDWMYWNEAGTLIKEEHWKAGDMWGEQREYNDKGELQIRTRYGKGKIIREQADTTVISYPGKNEKQITVRDQRKQKVKIERYKHGALHGKQQYYQNGKLEKVEFYDDGKVIEKVPFKDKLKKLKFWGKGEKKEKPVKEKKEKAKKQPEKKPKTKKTSK